MIKPESRSYTASEAGPGSVSGSAAKAETAKFQNPTIYNCNGFFSHSYICVTSYAAGPCLSRQSSQLH